MTPYEITNMIIDDDFYNEEFVTAEFTYENQVYSITFKKEDLDVVNAWVFKDGSSLPANLSNHIIESIRDEVSKKI